MARALAIARRHGSLITATTLVPVFYFVGTRVIDGFGSLASVNVILVLGTFLGIAAAGQTLVVLLGGIDLSVPYMISMGDVVGAELYQRGWPFVGVVCVVLGIAAVIGFVNGFVASRLGVSPLIITLGVGLGVQGGVQIWTHGAPTGSAPAWLTRFVSPGTHTGSLPITPLVFFWLGTAVVLIVFLARARLGRQIFAVGSSARAARLALVRPVKVWTLTFGLSAVFAAVAGLLFLGFTSTALPTVGDPYLFLSIGAVVIGGTSLLGGRGGYGRTVIGALVLTELTTILLGTGLSQALEQVYLGIIIIAAVAIYGREAHVRTRI